MYFLDEKFALRPETTMGSFEALKVFIDPNRKISKLPLVVYQHGKSFRKEQDQPTKFMRLKEFYQLEFQIAYAESTLDDYSKIVIPAVTSTIASFIGACKTENSDRLPDYSEETIDIICEKNNMEVCSISKRKDFPGAKILEVKNGKVHNYKNASYIFSDYTEFHLNGTYYGGQDDFDKKSWRRFVKLKAFL